MVAVWPPLLVLPVRLVLVRLAPPVPVLAPPEQVRVLPVPAPTEPALRVLLPVRLLRRLLIIRRALLRRPKLMWVSSSSYSS